MLSHEEVRKIAELAKLALSDEEVALYARQLSGILDDFQRLQALDTSQIAATPSVLPQRNVLRTDAAEPALPIAQVVANAAQSRGGQFLVDDVFADGD